MKVLIIAPNTKKESGGWGRYSHEIIDHLKNNGIEITFDPKDNFDIVHSLDIWPYALKGYRTVWGTNRKLILSGIGTYSVAPLKKWWQNLILKVIFKRTSKIVCISDYTRDQIKKYIPNAPVETVLMGLTKFAIKTEDRSEEKSCNPIILTVGEVKNRKGQLDTFKAILKLKEKYPNILYVTIGSLRDENYVQKIKTEAKNLGGENNLLMLEKISDEELGSWYKKANVFCLNSNNDEVHGHFEGFGLVILEAGQFGVPSVGSKDCGIESAIKVGVNGYLSRQGDSSDIAEKIEKALILGNSDKQKIVDYTNTFDWDKTVKRYIEIYQA